MIHGSARQKNFARGRSLARRYAMQALYQWQMTGHNLTSLTEQFLVDQDMRIDQDMRKTDIAYFQELLQQILGQLDHIDEVLIPFLDRPPDQVDPVERAILRIAAYELAYRLDIPYRVVINEGVEMAKRFGAEQGHRFINGVLDKIAHKVRIVEINQHKHR